MSPPTEPDPIDIYARTVGAVALVLCGLSGLAGFLAGLLYCSWRWH